MIQMVILAFPPIYTRVLSISSFTRFQKHLGRLSQKVHRNVLKFFTSW